ncbi:GxxExxY protein [Arenimonas sp. MALMAid1274]|uniref:GxxExxY protein n=1 Tax=Arenimonas sp. MALMAid1274 TaxID=3411630 RepID=UPI003B9F1187
MDADKGGLVEGALSDAVIGAFFDVYNELGPGFLESVYENSMAIALREAGLAVVQQAGIQVRYRGRVVGEYRADLLVEGRMMVEIKAASTLAPGHDAQLINYLKASGLVVGLLLNFGPRPQFKRRILSDRSIRDHPRKSVAKK